MQTTRRPLNWSRRRPTAISRLSTNYRSTFDILSLKVYFSNEVIFMFCWDIDLSHMQFYFSLNKTTVHFILIGQHSPLHHSISWEFSYFYLCIMRSLFDEDDGHERRPTSRHVVGTEIQRDCNFEAHVYHFSYRLGCMSSHWFILISITI